MRGYPGEAWDQVLLEKKCETHLGVWNRRVAFYTKLKLYRMMYIQTRVWRSARFGESPC